MKPYIYIGDKISDGGSALAKELGCRRSFRHGRALPRGNEIVINWGNSDCPYKALNEGYCVRRATNKLDAFQAFRNASVKSVDWTVNRDIVQSWFNEGYIVVGRKLLSASGGDGIVFLNPRQGAPDGHYTRFEDFPVCPLYTKYVNFKYEYRVHVFNGQVIDVVQKKRKGGDGGTKWVRNLENGWIYAREGVELPVPVGEEAIKAVAACGLDFGAVDVGYGLIGTFVLEVNTAPGLEGTTVKSYADAIRNFCQQK